MKYVVRVALGALLGLAVTAALWFFQARWWIGGVAGGLVAALGFLLTFFLWSADRLEEGYEQVLFDLPNNLVSGALAVALVGLAFGGGLLHKGSSAPDPSIAVADSQHDALVSLYNDVMGGKIDAAGLVAQQAKLKAAQEAVAALPAGEKATLLRTASAAAGKAFDELAKCSDLAKCPLARLEMTNAKAPLDAYAA